MDLFNEKLNEFKIPIGLLLVGGVLLAGGLFSSNLIQKDTVAEPKSYPSESMVSEKDLSEVKVDVAGAVNNPGVFSLSKEARIEDAVKLAGGFREEVSHEFVARSLNLSQKVSDGLKIYIPFEGEKDSVSVPAVAGASTVSASGKVNINSADQASLESLPGVGPVTAKKIIDGRPYSQIEELLSKKAVSKAVYSKIAEVVGLN